MTENSAYQSLISQLEIIDSQIKEIHQLLKEAKVVKIKTNHKSKKVSIGTRVVLEDKQGQRKTYFLVGDGEADPLKGKLSPNSPLAAAILGKKVGERVVVKTPQGRVSFKIVGIS